MTHREVFANAPLRVAGFEIGFPVTSRVATREVWDAFEAALGAEFPVVDWLVDDIERFVPSAEHGPVVRRLSEGRKRAVTVHPGAVSVEFADYHDYADMVRVVTAALTGVAAISDPLRCTQLGLRYFNEVRHPDITDTASLAEPSTWSNYINAELLRKVVSPPHGLCAFGWRGGLMMHSVSEDDDSHVFLEYGPFPGGAVSTEGVVSLDPVSGPCFVLDIDGQIPGSANSPVATTSEGVLAELDKLHTAVENAFEWATTEQLKEEVFRVPTSDVRPDELPAVASA
jgi:uncharacterized protein (TIGR04255 family)